MKWLMLAWALASCTEPSRGVQGYATNNAQVPVTLLFTHDGCEVFRFIDYDRARYYVRCAGNATVSVSSDHAYQCGTPKHPRTCFDDDDITTVKK